MPTPGGTITKKDLVTEDALGFGDDIKKQAKIAIDAFEDLKKSAREFNEIASKYRKANSQNAFLEEKQKEAIVLLQTTNAIKAEEAALISIEKVKQAAINTSKIEAQAQIAKINAQNKSVKMTMEEKVLNEEKNKTLKQEAKEKLGLVGAYEKLNKARTEAKNKLRDLLAAEIQNTLAIQEAQVQFDLLDARVRRADTAVRDFTKNVGNYPEIENLTNSLTELFAALGLVIGIDTFANAMQYAFEIVRDFEKEIVNLAAIAGKTRSEIEPLEAKIREVSKSSINGATDVAKLATELIKLGSTPEEVEKLLEPVNNLSVALQASAEDSATLVKSIMNAFNLGAEETARITDVLAESANRSALDFQGLRDSFSYLAPASKALGISVERTAAIIGILADNGIKAESAGRLTATSFARLADQGLTLEDALKKINKAQESGANELQVLSLASELFGAEAGKIGLILAANTEKIDENTIAYENSGGALKELTDKQLKSLDAELKILSSALEDYILDTNQSTGASISFTSAVRFLSTNLKPIINIIGYLVAGWLAYKSALLVANLQTKISELLAKRSAVAQARLVIATETSTAAQIANAEATIVANSAWARFNATLKANALGLALAGLIFFISVVSSYGKTLKESTQETIKGTDAFLKNREVVSKNAQSINTLSDRYDVLKSKSKLTKEEQKELNDILKILSKTVPDAVTEVDKYGDALALNTIKTREYITAQNELIKLQTTKKLQENIDLQKKLNSEKKTLTILETDLNAKYIEGIGYVRKRNGQLEVFNKIFETTRDLSLEEQILFKQKVVDNEKNSAIVAQNIKNLSGLTDAEKKASKAAEESSNKRKVSSERTIAVIDSEIQAQEDLINGLSDKTGRQGRAIKAKIEALKAEREMIYSTQKADNDRFKNEIENAKKVKEAIYNLSQFRLQVAIDLNKDLIDDENKSFEERLNALFEFQQLSDAKVLESAEYELSKLGYYNEEKKAFIRELSDFQIQEIIRTGETSKKLTAEQQLIYEKFQNELFKIAKKGEEDRQKLIDNQVAIIKKATEEEVMVKETAMNKEIEQQNKLLKNALDVLEVNKKINAENAKNGKTSGDDKSLKEALDAQIENNSLIEKAIESHERKVFEIRKKYAIEGLNVQVKALQELIDQNAKLPAEEQISAEKIKVIQSDLQKYKTEISDLELQQYKGNTEEKAEIEKVTAQTILEISQNLASAISDLVNALFDRKIANIDAEIQKSEEYYNSEIEKAGNDTAKKELLSQEAEKKRQVLEDKKRKEQHKQAVLNKAMSAVQVGLSTAMAIMQAYAQLGPIAGSAGAILAGIMGGIQLAAVLAAPIPKYAAGRLGGKKEIAMINDGGVQEVVTSADGSNPRIYKNKNSLVQLLEGDRVHKSADDYKRFLRASILTNLSMENDKMNHYQSQAVFDIYNDKLLGEMQKTTEAIKKQKQTIIVQSPKIDIPHSIWKHGNTNWS